MTARPARRRAISQKVARCSPPSILCRSRTEEGQPARIDPVASREVVDLQRLPPAAPIGEVKHHTSVPRRFRAARRRFSLVIGRCRSLQYGLSSETALKSSARFPNWNSAPSSSVGTRALGNSLAEPAEPTKRFLPFAQDIMLIPGQRREKVADDSARAGLDLDRHRHAGTELDELVLHLHVRAVE